jgi:hypothetical protein
MLDQLCKSAEELRMEDALVDPSDDDILIYAAERIDSDVDYDEVSELFKVAIIAAYDNARKCEFCGEKTATVYGGFSGSNDWAGYACDACSNQAKLAVWQRLARS